MSSRYFFSDEEHCEKVTCDMDNEWVYVLEFGWNISSIIKGLNDITWIRR